jgi:hypothetical protein
MHQNLYEVDACRSHCINIFPSHPKIYALVVTSGIHIVYLKTILYHAVSDMLCSDLNLYIPSKLPTKV